MAFAAGGVTSMGSPFIGESGFVNEGNKGSFVDAPFCWGSPEKGLRPMVPAARIRI